MSRAKFKITETVVCQVSWQCEIEAENEGEALRLFNEGERGTGETGPMIGDVLGDDPPELEIERVEVGMDDWHCPERTEHGPHERLEKVLVAMAIIVIIAVCIFGTGGIPR